MIRFSFLLLILAGCNPDFKNPYLGPVGLTPEDIDPKAPPSEKEIISRILTEVRVDRQLESKLDEGSRRMPEELDVKALRKCSLRNDGPERQGAVTETAYYSDATRVYYYHYEAASHDVWFGPFTLNFWRKPVPGFDQ